MNVLLVLPARWEPVIESWLDYHAIDATITLKGDNLQVPVPCPYRANDPRAYRHIARSLADHVARLKLGALIRETWADATYASPAEPWAGSYMGGYQG